jgi:centromere/kinetochore protein ZW10
VTSILNLYLIPQLPSSFGLLPPFLELVQACVDFEARYVVNLLDPESPGYTLRDWSDGLSGHYERQRRTAILARSRELLVEKIDLTATFQVDVTRPLDSSYPIAINGAEDEEEAWGFKDESALNTSQTDSWGFDDDAEPEVEDQPQAAEVKQPAKVEPMNGTSEDDIDTDDAWGWNDDENANEEAQADEVPLPQDESSTDEPTWDDDPWADPPSQEGTSVDETNWDDDPWGDPPPTNMKPAPAPASKPATTPTPKAATRLERLASKNKKQPNGASSQHSIASPPPPLSLTQPNSASTIAPSQRTTLPQSPNPPLNSSNHHRRPSKILVTAPTETYRVTSKTKQIARFVEDVVAESKQFAASNLFIKSSKSPTITSTSAPGSTLIQCSSSVLDLYQALYPVRFEKELSKIEGGLQFSNDCLYLSDSVDKIEREASHHPQLKERLGECRNDLKILGDSWFEDAVVSLLALHRVFKLTSG